MVAGFGWCEDRRTRTECQWNNLEWVRRCAAVTDELLESEARSLLTENSIFSLLKSCEFFEPLIRHSFRDVKQLPSMPGCFAGLHRRSTPRKSLEEYHDVALTFNCLAYCTSRDVTSLRLNENHSSACVLRGLN